MTKVKNRLEPLKKEDNYDRSKELDQRKAKVIENIFH